MKITTVTIQHTRQVRQYEPVVVSMTAEIKEGEDVMTASKAVQELVLRVAYKDDPKQRDFLIQSLVHANKGDGATHSQGGKNINF